MAVDPRTPKPFSTAADPSSSLNAAMQAAAQATQDLARRVSTLEQQRTVIGAKSLGGTLIADGAIVASHITAGNVVASIMTANLVNASHLDANSVRTSILNATAIVTQGLQTQVLTAVQAAISDLSSISTSTGTLTASLIRTASSGSRVELGATVGGIKGYNASNVLTFGFDTTTGAATVGAITVTGANGTSVPASTLTGFVGGGNLVKDSSFESTDPATPGSLWVNSGSGGVATKQTAQSFHGSTSLRVLYGAPSGGVYTNLRTNHGVPITSLRNRPVVASVWVYITGTDNTTPAADRIMQMADDVAAITAGAPAASTIPKNTWTRVVQKAILGAAINDAFITLLNPWSSGNNTVYFDGLQFEFGDAATAYNPKADEILYGQINTVELAAGAVKAGNVDAGAITAEKISLGVATVVIKNGQFSEGNPANGTSLTTNWSDSTTGTVTVETDAAWPGRIARITTPTGGGFWRAQDVAMPVGRNVVRAWIKTTALTGTGAAISLGTGTATATRVDSVNITGTTDWTLVEAVATVTVPGTVRVFVFAAAGSGTANFANVHIVPAITGTTLTPNAVETLLITGGVVRTATGGARVELDSTNGLRAIDSGSNVVFQANLSGGVSMTGSLYAKTGMTMDSVNSLTPGANNRIGFLTGSTLDASISAQPGALLGKAISGGTTGYLLLTPTDLTVTLNSGTLNKTIASTGTFTSFVETGSLTTQRIGGRQSASINVAAGATQSINITAGAPSGSTSFPMVVFVGTNAQRLTWAWGSLGTTCDIYNPTGATITGTLYWKWIVEV